MLSFTRHVKENTLSWPDNYYAESSGKKRGELLKEQMKSDDTWENRIRYALWEKRYTSPRKGITGVDYYMKMIIDLDIIVEKQSSLLKKRSFNKKKQEIRDLFCLDLLKENPGLAGIWRDEFIHFWAQYIELCQKDKGYSSLILGMGHMSGDTLAQKIREDVYQKAVVVPEKLGMEDQLRPCRNAAEECLAYYLP